MINVKEFNSLMELMEAFPTEESCIKYLESLYWKDGVVISPYDRKSKVYIYSNNRYICKNTGLTFNVKTGTIFHNTKLSLRKWFIAIWLITSHKKGISSLQLSRDIKVTQKTAWFLLHRIRFCLDAENVNVLDKEVEADETFIGGKNKNRCGDKKVEGSQGRSCKDKTSVLGMIQRKGKVTARVIENTSQSEITPLIKEYILRSATLYTDEWSGYNEVSKLYNHFRVNHSMGEYVNGDAYTNTIEGFWTLLKRGYVGIYHSMSRKYLHRYVDEFVFRYNTRKMSESDRFIDILGRTCAYRMTYNDLKYGVAA